jgi:capsular polysaccharide biosynthesis protein
MSEQLDMVANAKIVVAPHGAGLSWAVFQKCGILIEIHGPYLISLSYETIVNNNPNVKYAPFFCDQNRINHSSVKGREFDDYQVDLDRFNSFFMGLIS